MFKGKRQQKYGYTSFMGIHFIEIVYFFLVTNQTCTQNQGIGMTTH